MLMPEGDVLHGIQLGSRMMELQQAARKDARPVVCVGLRRGRDPCQYVLHGMRHAQRLSCVHGLEATPCHCGRDPCEYVVHTMRHAQKLSCVHGSEAIPRREGEMPANMSSARDAACSEAP